MTHENRIVSLFWIGLSSWVMIKSYHIGLGDLNNPGSGFIFFWSSLVLGSLSILLFLSSFFKGKEKKIEQPFMRLKLKPRLMVVGSLLVYTFILETVGFLITTFIFMTFLLSTIGSIKGKLVIPIAGAIAIIAYVIFEIWLRVQLPKGFIGF
ncbi:MAG: tripartite tricarboxylate transporter TctB family protein [Deltaproteobacteria bacterium]